MFYCHTQTNDILKLSGTNGMGIVGRDIAPFVYEPYPAERVGRQFGKDAIHFDLIEGHEWNKKRNISILKKRH